jgi:hypothetical protein
VFGGYPAEDFTADLFRKIVGIFVLIELDPALPVFKRVLRNAPDVRAQK